ncbi:hypothetical protein HD806DRAFT_534288 [Xylariaceae sp. AK1471]|nr:hypothetical protein HD806DRAFT_534288 [Xylariaceae sp. AK1471]
MPNVAYIDAVKAWKLHKYILCRFEWFKDLERQPRLRELALSDEDHNEDPEDPDALDWMFRWMYTETFVESVFANEVTAYDAYARLIEVAIRYEVYDLNRKLLKDLEERLSTKAIWAQKVFHEAADKHEQMTERDLQGLMASVYTAYDLEVTETAIVKSEYSPYTDPKKCSGCGIEGWSTEDFHWDNIQADADGIRGTCNSCAHLAFIDSLYGDVGSPVQIKKEPRSESSIEPDLIEQSPGDSE